MNKTDHILKIQTQAASYCHEVAFESIGRVPRLIPLPYYKPSSESTVQVLTGKTAASNGFDYGHSHFHIPFNYALGHRKSTV